MALVYQETRAEAVCSLEQDVLVLLNDKSRMKGDLHVRFCEKFEVEVLLLTRLRGRELITPFYSILPMSKHHTPAPAVPYPTGSPTRRHG